jgi:hypothetical protein
MRLRRQARAGGHRQAHDCGRGHRVPVTGTQVCRDNLNSVKLVTVVQPGHGSEGLERLGEVNEFPVRAGAGLDVGLAGARTGPTGSPLAAA